MENGEITNFKYQVIYCNSKNKKNKTLLKTNDWGEMIKFYNQQKEIHKEKCESIIAIKGNATYLPLDDKKEFQFIKAYENHKPLDEFMKVEELTIQVTNPIVAKQKQQECNRLARQKHKALVYMKKTNDEIPLFIHIAQKGKLRKSDYQTLVLVGKLEEFKEKYPELCDF